MKKFFYACAAILCLVLSYHFGATSAQGQVPGQVRLVGGDFFATQNGIWELIYDTWQPLSAMSLHEPPVPVSDVLYYRSNMVVTTGGEGFYWNGSGWTSAGVVPGSPTPVTQQSWGQVKARYR